MIGVLTNAERHAQMAKAIGKFPLLKKKAGYGRKRISIACYGPSLCETWQDIRNPIISVSGAHDFLIERGIVPTYHVECDPREHKTAMLAKPHRGVRYLMASVCHPAWWLKFGSSDHVDDHGDRGKASVNGNFVSREVSHKHNIKVFLWHLVNGDDLETVAWVAEHHPEGMGSLIGGGSTVGQRAMNVGAALGYRKFDIYGMDCSFTGSERHAGPHSGPPQNTIFVQAGSRKFQTTKQMIQAAIEMEHFLQSMDAEVRFHGDGLIQEMARIINRRKDHERSRVA